MIKKWVNIICLVFLALIVALLFAAAVHHVVGFFSEMLTWTWPYGGNGQWLW